MPVESAFKLHLITLNRGRLARVLASFGQKLVFLKTGFKGPRMRHAQLWFRMLTPQSRRHPASPSPPWSAKKLLVQASLSWASGGEADRGLLLWAHSALVSTPCRQHLQLETGFVSAFTPQPGRAVQTRCWRPLWLQLHCLDPVPGSALYWVN